MASKTKFGLKKAAGVFYREVADANDGQVGSVVQQLFPAGAGGVDLGEAVRQVFPALKRQRV